MIERAELPVQMKSTLKGVPAAGATLRNAWLRDAQRFPVDVEFDMAIEDERKLRVGAQASVIIYTGDRGFINALGRLQVRIASLMTYAY